MVHQEPNSITPDMMVVRPYVRLAVHQPDVVSSDWRERLPLLGGDSISLRELQLSDAPTLLAMLSTEEVSRFISPPPTTLEGYERFIEWAQRRRAAGELVCFGIVPHGMTTAVGIIQVRSLEKGFGTAEWGFALGSPFWGNGMFIEGAQIVLEFAFGEIGVHRMEARCAVHNGRGNGALQKLGAVREVRLRKSFVKNGTCYDQFLSAILSVEWTLREKRYRPRPVSQSIDGSSGDDPLILQH
jgi:ribosomal-protein-alanine N-acetyltransferase